MNATKNPLVVDLDGTLTRSDLLFESVCGLLKLNLFYAFLLPVWLLGGKANMKQKIAEKVDLEIELLPWQEEFVAYLRDQKAAGRKLILATASNEKYAQQIADYFGFFDAVIASDAKTNASGSRKLAKLKELLGDEQFDYAGNAKIDVAIWQQAGSAVVVNPLSGVAAAAAATGPVEATFDDRKASWKAFVKAIRPHQWLKNGLIFVPMFLAQAWGDASNWIAIILAFVSFSLCASSVYLLNDMLDMPSDRKHPTKCKRPFAAGELSIVTGAAGVGLLVLAAFFCAMFVSKYFFVVLFIYYIVTMAYSTVLKRAALLDVITLASLYTLRLIAGAAAIYVQLSFWLLAFSMFVFLSLALMKRYSELLVQASLGRERLAGRAYRAEDLPLLSQLGAASGYLGVMVLALYVESDDVTRLYSNPQSLWLLCPIMLYWISRMWLLTTRGEMHDDPIVFTIEDRRTHWMAVIAAISLWGAV